MHVEGSKCFFKDGDTQELLGITASMGMRNGNAPEYFQAQCRIKHEDTTDVVDPPSASSGTKTVKRKKGLQCRMFLKFTYDTVGCECALNNWLIHGYTNRMSAAEHVELGSKTMSLLEDHWASLTHE